MVQTVNIQMRWRFHLSGAELYTVLDRLTVGRAQYSACIVGSV
jgi:hypothetical protein